MENEERSSQKRVLRPLKNSVVCRKVGDSGGTYAKDSLLLKNTEFPVYEIVEYAVDDLSSFPFSLGDKVVTQCKGDELEINPGEVVYMFKAESIAAKIIE